MAQAEIVSITSRRNFLVGAGIASAAIVTPLAVMAAPATAGEVRPELKVALATLDAAADALSQADDALFSAEQKLKVWQEVNPEPVMSNDYDVRDGEAVNTAFNRERMRISKLHGPWMQQRAAMRKELRMSTLCESVDRADGECREAIEAFATLPATNMAEVFFKAEAACDYDVDRYQIAANLAVDLLDIRDAATI